MKMSEFQSSLFTKFIQFKNYISSPQIAKANLGGQCSHFYRSKCYRSPKTEKSIKATLNGIIYMNKLEIKSRNIKIACVILFNCILTVISSQQESNAEGLNL